MLGRDQRRRERARLVALDAHLVRVEADTAPGFPKFSMVGLPDSAVKESEGRIRAALRNCGYDFKWDRSGKSSKHFPFDWSGPDE